MATVARANLVAGVWRPASRGGTFLAPGAGAGSWPQSGLEDVKLVRQAAREGTSAWRALSAGRRAALLGDLSLAVKRELEPDSDLCAVLGQRFGLCTEESARLLGERASPAGENGARPDEACALAWLAPDWRELVRGAFLALARELERGRAVVLVSDPRLPEIAAHLAAAGARVGLPAGTLGLLHGATRELVAHGLASSAGQDATLVASGLVERIVELRRLCEQLAVAEPRLLALRAGAYEVDPARELALGVSTVLEQAFGRATTLGGQLPGALARVHCPARLFSRFSELFLAALEESDCARAPVPLLDAETRELVRSARELGLDEGATLVAGGEEEDSSGALAPSVFTNVEPSMACAQRQDPLPVLCLLRAP